MYKGSCLCGEVKYTLKQEPTRASHCHCRMCQKQHGAAFATYINLHKDDVVYTHGLDSLLSYHSSGSIVRKFCQHCGSNIEWSSAEQTPDRVAITLCTLDTPYSPKQIKDIYTDTKVKWLG